MAEDMVVGMEEIGKDDESCSRIKIAVETILQNFEVELSNETDNMDQAHEELSLTESEKAKMKCNEGFVQFTKGGQEVKIRKLKLRKESNEQHVDKKWTIEVKLEGLQGEVRSKISVVEKMPGVFERVETLTKANLKLQTELETEKKSNRHLTLQLEECRETIDGLKEELEKEKGNAATDYTPPPPPRQDNKEENEGDIHQKADSMAAPAKSGENLEEFSVTPSPPACSTTSTRRARSVTGTQSKSQKRKHSGSARIIRSQTGGTMGFPPTKSSK